MACDIRRVSWADILSAPAWPALLAEYSAECSIPEIGTPDPQPTLYALMESTGILQCFGAYDGAQLIGFASVQAFPLPHYGKRVANVESLFVPQVHRRFTVVGLELLRTARKYGRQQGCKVILYNAPVGSSFERLLELRRRSRRTNSVFCEVL